MTRFLRPPATHAALSAGLPAPADESAATRSRIGSERVLCEVETSADSKLVAGLKRREALAFDQIYALYSAPLLRFLSRLCGRADLAEDVFQESFLRLAKHSERLAPDTDLFAWLLTVSRNIFLSHARGALRLRPLHESGEQPARALTPDAQALARESLTRLERGLLRLSQEDREVLLLVGVEGLSHQRCAVVLGINEPALRKRVSRARARLAELLDEASPARLLKGTGR